jgi:hypothetical protein
MIYDGSGKRHSNKASLLEHPDADFSPSNLRIPEAFSEPRKLAIINRSSKGTSN